MATTYLQRTESAGNRRTFTWSAWVKISRVDITKFLAACSYSSSDESYFMINSSAQLGWESSTSNDGTVRTNRLFRDTNAWYHIVLAVDTTQATAENRIKFYVNGVQETSMSTATYPAQNHQLYWNVGGTYYPRIGKRHASGNEWDGSMSHVSHIDGTQELPTIFGETDSTTGEWKIKTTITPSSGWGTNGYHILKDGNSVTDQSGQGNNWSVGGGTLTKTEDNPSNVFATLNVLERLGSNITVSNGNTQFFNQASDWRTIISNLAFPNTGKFYAEMQVNEVSSAVQVGIMAQSSFVSHFQADLGTQGQYNGYAYMNTGQKRTNNSASNYGGSFAGGIIGIAVDMDNKNIYFSKDGTWQNSGNPESGATGTGAAFTDLQIDKDYCFAVASQGSNPKVSWNFGNGYFGTTAVSSAGTNASGNGIFEYDVPTGYTALSTKGLNL